VALIAILGEDRLDVLREVDFAGGRRRQFGGVQNCTRNRLPQQKWTGDDCDPQTNAQWVTLEKAVETTKYMKGETLGIRRSLTLLRRRGNCPNFFVFVYFVYFVVGTPGFRMTESFHDAKSDWNYGVNSFRSLG
jgi:hypothetical protein